MINGVILSKLQMMDEMIEELRSLNPIKISELENEWMKRRAIERNLQVLCEIVVDICQRLIAISDKTPATTGAGAVDRCVKMGVLKSAEPYKKMIQFRNFIVHRYERVDPTILVDIVNNRLSDFELFHTEVMEYVSN